ncbi:MAG: NAD(P)-dependent alcohol dehydrogenase [Candidatus Parvarchaeota archaeon]
MEFNAMVLSKFNEPLTLQKLQIGEPHGREVIIKILAAGMCGTDFAISQGIELKPGFKLPMVLGHENVGEIINMGDLVENYNIGDKVAVYPAWGCGKCRWCRSGYPNLCPYQATPGQTGYNGGYAEYMVVPDYNWLYKIGTLNPVEVAPLVDAGTTSLGAIKKILPNVSPGSCVIVNGVGGLATYTIQLLKALMPSLTIIAVSRKDSHLAFARKLGADIAIKPAELKENVDDVTGKEGADAAIDLVSNNDTVQLLNSVLSVNGKLVLVGAYGESANLNVFTTMVYQHSISGSNYGTYQDMVDVIKMYSMKLINSYIIKRKLEDANEGLEAIRSGSVLGRQVIVPD